MAALRSMRPRTTQVEDNLRDLGVIGQQIGAGGLDRRHRAKPEHSLRFEVERAGFGPGVVEDPLLAPQMVGNRQTDPQQHGDINAGSQEQCQAKGEPGDVRLRARIATQADQFGEAQQVAHRRDDNRSQYRTGQAGHEMGKGQKGQHGQTRDGAAPACFCPRQAVDRTARERCPHRKTTKQACGNICHPLADELLMWISVLPLQGGVGASDRGRFGKAHQGNHHAANN